MVDLAQANRHVDEMILRLQKSREKFLISLASASNRDQITGSRTMIEFTDLTLDRLHELKDYLR